MNTNGQCIRCASINSKCDHCAFDHNNKLICFKCNGYSELNFETQECVTSEMIIKNCIDVFFNDYTYKQDIYGYKKYFYSAFICNKCEAPT